MPVEKFNQTKENFNNLIAFIESCWIELYYERNFSAASADRETGERIGKSGRYIRTIRLGKYLPDKKLN